MIKDLVRPFIPRGWMPFARSLWRRWLRSRTDALPPLSEEQFHEILTQTLQLQAGDVVFVHSSTDYLSIDFPFFRILAQLLEIVGEDGCLVFPTYPHLPSGEFLAQGCQFDVRKTPSYTGALTEFARRHSKAHRSLHPTKSVCAIGRAADYLTADHHRSPRPYGPDSPYGRVAELGGKVIGLGVPTSNLSFVHCTDDLLAEEFPVDVYQPTLFQASCIDAEGREVIVPTYAHDLAKMIHNIPGFMKRHVAPAICQDLEIDRMNFFRAEAQPLLQRMVELAREGVTIYPRRTYSRRAAA